MNRRKRFLFLAGSKGTTPPVGGTKPTITTASFPTMTQNAYNNFPLAATGDTPITWKATGMPFGLYLNPTTGNVDGSTFTSGPYSVVITATNAAGSTSKTFTGTIGAYVPPPPTPPVITGDFVDSGNGRELQLSQGAAGTPYSHNLSATGTNPITWSATDLPSWMTLDAQSGVLSGTPTGGEGTLISITATNAAGSDQVTAYLLVTEPIAAPTITTTSLPDTYTTQLYTQTLSATGSGPITWSSDNLPVGLSLDSDTGVLNGDNIINGPHTIHFTATNAGGSTTVTIPLNVYVNSGTPSGDPAYDAQGAATLTHQLISQFMSAIQRAWTMQDLQDFAVYNSDPANVLLQLEYVADRFGPGYPGIEIRAYYNPASTSGSSYQETVQVIPMDARSLPDSSLNVDMQNTADNISAYWAANPTWDPNDGSVDLNQFTSITPGSYNSIYSYPASSKSIGIGGNRTYSQYYPDQLTVYAPGFDSVASNAETDQVAADLVAAIEAWIPTQTDPIIKTQLDAFIASYNGGNSQIGDSQFNLLRQSADEFFSFVYNTVTNYQIQHTFPNVLPADFVESTKASMRAIVEANKTAADQWIADHTADGNQWADWESSFVPTIETGDPALAIETIAQLRYTELPDGSYGPDGSFYITAVNASINYVYRWDPETSEFVEGTYI